MRTTILHFYALCTFPKSEALRHARAQCTNNIPSHAPSKSTRRTVSVYQLSRRSLKVSRSKEKMSIAYVCAMCIVHVLSRALCNSSSNAMYHRITHIELHQCTKFGVASLKFPRTGGPLSNKVFFSNLARAPCIPRERQPEKAYRLGQYTCDLQVWDRWCTSSCLQWRQKKKRYKTLARALHVHSALQHIKSYGAKYTMPRSTHLLSLVSLAKNFPAPEDPTSKKLSDPGACSLHPTGTATTKAHTLGLYTCDLQICGRWCLPFVLQSWLEVCASLHAAARATCHVRRAPLKSTKSRVRRLGLSTLKFWCECTAPFHARLQKAR